MSQARSGSPVTRTLTDRAVGTKILSAVAVALLVALGVGALAISRMSGLAAGAQGLYTGNVQGVSLIGDLQSAALRTRLNVVNLLVAQSDEAMATSEKGIAEQDALVADLTAKYAALDAGAHAEELTVLAENWKGYQQVRDTLLVPLARDTKVKEFDRARTEKADPLLVAAFEAIATISTDEQAEAKSSAAAAARSASGARNTVLVVLALGLVLAVGSPWSSPASSPGRSPRVNEVLSAVADGDLTKTASGRQPRRDRGHGRAT